MTSDIASELFLLLTADGGRQDATQYRRHALTAAAITELLLHQRISLDEGRNPRVQVLHPTPTGVAPLDLVLAHLARDPGQKLKGLLYTRRLDLTEMIGDAQVAAGTVTRKDGWFLTSWPQADHSAESELRERMVRSLDDPAQASMQDRVLWDLLRALRVAHRVMRPEVGSPGRRELERRLDAFGEIHPVCRVLRRLIDEQTAVAVG